MYRLDVNGNKEWCSAVIEGILHYIARTYNVYLYDKSEYLCNYPVEFITETHIFKIMLDK